VPALSPSSADEAPVTRPRNSQPILRFAGRSCDFSCGPLLVGIVNVTPDSFSDGGQFLDPARAVDHALSLVDQGADWLDIGGESTRPGADPVDADTELRRVLPVIEILSQKTDKTISVDTYKSEVARAALAVGATVINDVTGFRDSAMIQLAAETRAGCVVMHMRGTPADMMQKTDYQDVVVEVLEYWRGRLDRLGQAGVDLERTILDPGIGFAKLRPANLRLLNRLEDLQSLGRPVLLGASRKRIISEIAGLSPAARVNGTIASSVLAYTKGVQLLRVHDVGAVREAIAMAQAIENEGADLST
jgi:dihydropteroate synthase